MKKSIELIGGAAFNYHASVAVAKLLTEYCPRVRASPTETAGSVANLEMSQGRDPNSFLLMTVGDSYICSRLGVGVWEDKEPITDLRWICGMDWGHHAFVTLDPDAKTVADLKGKKVAIPSYRSVLFLLREAFNIVGIKVTIESMGFDTQYAALRDGLVDACLWLSSGPPGSIYINIPPLKKVIEHETLYGIPFPRELYLQAKKGASSKLGYEPAYFPTVALAGTLPTQTEDMEVFSGVVLGYLCKESADEELVYEITKTLATHYYRLGEMFPALDKVTPHLMVQLMYLGRIPGVEVEDEIHSGALRYYKEVGLWPRAWEKRAELVLE